MGEAGSIEIKQMGVVATKGVEVKVRDNHGALYSGFLEASKEFLVLRRVDRYYFIRVDSICALELLTPANTNEKTPSVGADRPREAVQEQDPS